MNCVIGLCIKGQSWPSTLYELGYGVQVIEQSIRTGSGDQVKPDIIAVSSKHIHCLVFDCKGGASVDADQLSRYGNLRIFDLQRWVTIYAPNQLTFDLCFADLEKNHQQVIDKTEPYPLLTFGSNFILKTREFKLPILNRTFGEAINLVGMYQPFNYYPFSIDDHDAVIIPRVLRMIIKIAFSMSRGGPSALAESTFDSEDILSKIHPYWKALSMEHRKLLIIRIRDMIRRVMDSEPQLKNALVELENSRGYKIRGPLNLLQTVSEGIIKKVETQETLSKHLA